jgi:hypothetical protein
MCFVNTLIKCCSVQFAIFANVEISIFSEIFSDIYSSIFFITWGLTSCKGLYEFLVTSIFLYLKLFSTISTVEIISILLKGLIIIPCGLVSLILSIVVKSLLPVI